MTIFKVTNKGYNEDEKKGTHSVKLKGKQGDLELSLTIKSEFKSSIEKIVPLIVGEERDIEIIDPNRKLDEFNEKPVEKPVQAATLEPTEKIDHSLEGLPPVDDIGLPLKDFDPEDEL